MKYTMLKRQVSYIAINSV